VDWVLGAAGDTPAGEGLSFVVPGSALCRPAAPPVVIARATDDLGVYAEVEAAIEILPGGPTLRIAGASPAGRIVLRPGGTPAELEAEAWPGCGGPVSFAWSATGLAPIEDGGVESGPTWSRWSVVLPDAAYPGILDAVARVGVAASEGAYSGSAELALDPDGTGLVEVSHRADRARLAPGERAILTTTLRSRISVTLPGVRVVHALDGLAPDGPPAARGAAIVAVDAAGIEVTLDLLPAAGAEVSIDLPVRATGGPAASAASIVSAGGSPLSPPASARSAGTPGPGCACGSRDGGALAILAAAAAVLRRRRRPSVT
jgi:MYXO-CTERM domain-containing protein